MPALPARREVRVLSPASCRLCRPFARAIASRVASFTEPLSVFRLVDHVRHLVRDEDVVRSTSIRAIVVTGIPLWTVTSRGCSVVRWMRVAVVTRRRSRDNDIDDGGPVLAHLPELRHGQVAQRRPLTGLQHGREECALPRERHVADGIDAPRHPVQSPAADPSRDRVAVQPGREELREVTNPCWRAANRAISYVRRRGRGTKLSYAPVSFPTPRMMEPCRHTDLRANVPNL